MTLLRHYKAVLIDWDNTLGDFHGSAMLAMKQIFSDMQLERYFDSFEQWYDLYMPNNVQLWELYGEGKISREYLSQERFDYPFRMRGFNDMGKLALEIENQFEELATQHTQLMPDAMHLLQYLADKYPVTVLTNGFPEVQYTKFRNTGVMQYFTHIVISEEVGVAKPDPGIFEIALQRNNVMPEDAIMIGDHYNVDIVGAQRAGIDQIYFCPDAEECNALSATYHVHNLIEITNIL